MAPRTLPGPVGGRSGRSSPRFLFDWNAEDGLDDLGRLVARTGQVGAFSRGGTVGAATTVDRNGVVHNVASQQPRFHHQYNSSTGLWEPVGVLLTPARTNYHTYSNDLTNAAWTKAGAAAVALDITGPDGVANNATTVSVLGGGSGNSVYQLPTITAANGTRVEPSAWLYKISPTGTIRFGNAQGGAFGRWDINLALLSAGWNHVTRSHAAVSINTEFVIDTNRSGIQVYSSDAGPLSVGVWCAQIELGAFSSSSIPTTTAAVTRAADALSFAFNAVPQAMTVYVDIWELGTALGNLGLWHIGTGGASATQASLVGDASGGKYRVYANFTDGAGYAQGQTTAPTFGARLELRSVLAATGPLTTGQSISGGTEEVLTNAATRTLDAAWSAATLSIGSYSGGAVGGFVAFRSLRIAAGVQTMDYMRAA